MKTESERLAYLERAEKRFMKEHGCVSRERDQSLAELVVVEKQRNDARAEVAELRRECDRAYVAIADLKSSMRQFITDCECQKTKNWASIGCDRCSKIDLLVNSD